MSKGTGLGARFYVGGYDISGDTQSIEGINGGQAVLDVTDITQSAHSRLPGLRDGSVEFTSFFDKTGAHVPLSALPTANTIATVLVPPLLIGNAAACLNGKQINYDPTRAADGSLTLKTQVQGSLFGLEWGVMMSPLGVVTYTGGSQFGTTWDSAAALSFGGQAYLQVTAFTGTDATVKFQDSADNATWTDIAGFAFTQITAAPQAQRIALANTATIRRYVRSAVVTTGGYTNLTIVTMLNKNPVAGVTF